MTILNSAYRKWSFHDFRIRAQYDLQAKGGSVAEDTLFMNMGYWKDQPQSLDEASRALARLVAEMARLGKDDNILDVGCGFGDNALLWMEEFAPAKISLVNISKKQLSVAGERITQRGWSERISLWVASATELPFEEGAFDKVTCVEASHDFDSREAFFLNAHKVLKPGGKLILADLLHPPETRDTYLEKLQRAGFVNVDARSIRQEVFDPFVDHLLRRAEKANPVSRWMTRAYIAYTKKTGVFQKLDFVITTAERPSRPN
ncbi:class I SAM-dependent methyltransferase [Myxococcus sp. AM009]|uniref:SAM-dependent methyltransferase n=1 Tax=unclassified Myxococcus TaxID=2648731 RepID=UPI001594EB35|nr:MULTISPECIES: class I SAM-dependent methyltransferase [unclassified Myxococcus]NVI98256.1 class I SAM-dependent methyltransferase [Myxococcus sp. AM009]NVJ14873.1 class I SAM-dependent methyltransferase [Myxococcus sp. AM010]